MSDEKPGLKSREEFLAGIDPIFNEFIDFLPELNKESDRGLVLIATSFIDELLKRILMAFFADKPTAAKLLHHMGPLGTLEARAQTAFALGLISEAERHDIDKLRKIRNEFAHSVKVTFEAQSMLDLCDGLKFAKPGPADGAAYARVGFKPRDKVNMSVVAIIIRLVQREPEALEQKRTAVSWQ